MNILLLTQVVPYPPDSGPKIKTYNVLRHLAQRHSVHLVSFVRSSGEAASAAALRHLCAGVTTVPLQRSGVRDVAYLGRSIVTGRPFLIERDDSRAMRAAILDLLHKYAFDAVHADQLSMAQFANDLAVPLRVLDEHNAVWTIVKRAAQHDAMWPRRLLAELEWRKLRAYEGRIGKHFHVTTVVSTEDRQALCASAGVDLPTVVIPIAVDTRELAFAPRTPDAKHIISVATMFYPPNVEGVYWFATEVFPFIKRAFPETVFYIIGSRPPRKIMRLATARSGIVVTGYQADLTPFFRQSAVSVVPVHSGSGLRVKILEAFARGIPVVSTNVGVEGIAAVDGEHLLVADDPVRFALAVNWILTRPLEAARLAEAGRTLVEAQYDWRSALSGLDEIYSTASGDTGVSASLQQRGYPVPQHQPRTD